MKSPSNAGDGLQEYYEALDRLVNNTPIHVQKNEKITLNSVALEADKSLGSIKKSRPIYTKLIEDIQHFATETNRKRSSSGQRVKEAKNRASHYRLEAQRFELLWKEALGRELMLLTQLDKAQQQLNKISNVVDFQIPTSD